MKSANCQPTSLCADMEASGGPGNSSGRSGVGIGAGSSGGDESGGGAPSSGGAGRGRLPRLQWEHASGASSFAVPTTHEDRVMHLSTVLSGGVTDLEHTSSKNSASLHFCNNVEAYGMVAMKQENEEKQIWEEYPAQAGYLCQNCMDKRHHVIRPPFESAVLLQWTDRVTFVPDNKPTPHFRLVFNAAQRDKLVSCGYQEVKQLSVHMPSDPLSDFVSLRSERPEKRRRVAQVDSNSSQMQDIPHSGPGVDSVRIYKTIPDYKTPQQLCDIVEKGYFHEGVYYSPMYRIPPTKQERQSIYNQTCPGGRGFDTWNNNVENRWKEYLNLINHAQRAFELMSEKDKSAWGDASHLVPSHDLFRTMCINKTALRSPLGKDNGKVVGDRVCETVRSRFAASGGVFRPPFSAL